MKHFRCSHNQKQPPHVCPFCKFESNSSNDLYRHIAGNHSQEVTPATYSRPGPLSSKQKRAAQQQAYEEMEVENEPRFEPITEAFIFEDQIIHPCYVVLPFSTKKDIEDACNPHRNVSQLSKIIMSLFTKTTKYCNSLKFLQNDLKKIESLNYIVVKF